MEAYFKARKTCDLEALSTVYGNTSSEEILNEQSVRMEEEVKFYQSFENLVCYTAPGVDDGDYVVYARFDIKFRQAETLAPSMRWQVRMAPSALWSMTTGATTAKTEVRLISINRE